MGRRRVRRGVRAGVRAERREGNEEERAEPIKHCVRVRWHSCGNGGRQLFRTQVLRQCTATLRCAQASRQEEKKRNLEIVDFERRKSYLFEIFSLENIIKKIFTKPNTF